MRIEPKDPLFQLLKACGVDPADVEIALDDLCQENVLTFGGGQGIADTTLSRLAELSLTFPSRFVFASQGVQARFDAAIRNTPRMQAASAEMDRDRIRLRAAHGLSGFPSFNPDEESLAAFARRAEAACGFEPGTALSAGVDRLSVHAPSRSMQHFVLLSLVQQSAPQVPVVITIVGRQDR